MSIQQTQTRRNKDTQRAPTQEELGHINNQMKQIGTNSYTVEVTESLPDTTAFRIREDVISLSSNLSKRWQMNALAKATNHIKLSRRLGLESNADFSIHHIANNTTFDPARPWPEIRTDRA
jgi:hypothetical protein